ncbi:hypothetical protein SK128_005025 [Halocaridina rubra]|uniref:Uncharacterized protein n=1 Tax=Halocaridina rubra TaxID=373956 RepID=A0AAN8XDG4_HALRR
MSEEMSDSGWTTILNWMSSPSQQPNETEFVYGFGNVSDDDDFYFLGLKNLTDMMWTNVTPTEQIANPFVFQFVITTENGDYHATYDEVLIQPTAPWQLLSVGIYHGNAAFLKRILRWDPKYSNLFTSQYSTRDNIMSLDLLSYFLIYLYHSLQFILENKYREIILSLVRVTKSYSKEN